MPTPRSPRVLPVPLTKAAVCVKSAPGAFAPEACAPGTLRVLTAVSSPRESLDPPFAALCVEFRPCACGPRSDWPAPITSSPREPLVPPFAAVDVSSRAMPAVSAPRAPLTTPFADVCVEFRTCACGPTVSVPCAPLALLPPPLAAVCVQFAAWVCAPGSVSRVSKARAEAAYRRGRAIVAPRQPRRVGEDGQAADSLLATISCFLSGGRTPGPPPLDDL
eukprot:scaffold63946_cov31-Tisochrysis_lutea.AAC.1